MNLNWREVVEQILLAMLVAGVLLFAAVTTSRLHSQDRKLHAGATREPQLADPAAVFIEAVLETSPLAQLSAGYAGIAPSMHMIRLGATRPMSNIDPIEHPARRRFGRVDFTFAFLVFLPIAMIPFAYRIYRRCVVIGSTDALLSGRTRLFDFMIERVMLPLLASCGFVGLVTIACLYGTGLRVGSNELLGLAAIWGVLMALYLLFWVLVLAYFLIVSESFPAAILKYAATFLVLVFFVPQLIQTVSLAVERPEGRLPLIVERRKIANQIKRDEKAGIDRFFTRKGYGPLDWSKPLPRQQFVAVENMRIEDGVGGQLKEFEEKVNRLDRIALATSWLTPYLVAQCGADDAAGTGLARYDDFRVRSAQFHEAWRKYMLDFVAKRQFLDLDALRAAPKFTMPAATSANVALAVLARCAYLLVLCGVLAYVVARELKKILPENRKAAR